MKGLLLLLSVGATIYTLLVITHDVSPGDKAEDIFAGQTQPNQPGAQHLSSWGTYLPSRSSQKPQAPLAVSQEPARLQQNAADEPRATDPRQNSERKPGASYQLAASEAKAPASGSDGGAPVKWARVVLAAPMHDHASVDSPTAQLMVLAPRKLHWNPPLRPCQPKLLHQNQKSGADPRSALNPRFGFLILEPLNAPFGQTTSPGGTRGVSDGLDAPTGGVGSGYLCLAPPSDGQLV